MPHKGEYDDRWRGLYLPISEIMQQIGQLFLLRTNINSVGSVLDSPVSLSTKRYGPLSSHLESRKSFGYAN